jgi:hypothetical protein
VKALRFSQWRLWRLLSKRDVTSCRQTGVYKRLWESCCCIWWTGTSAQRNMYCLWYYDSHSCSSTLKFETAGTSETLVPICHITRRHIPLDRNVNIQRYKKLKFRNTSCWRLWLSMVSQLVSYCSLRPTRWEKFYILRTRHDIIANGVSWVLTPCTITRLFRRFGGKCCSASSWTIFSDLEDGGINFPWNFGRNIILHDVSNQKTIREAKPPSNAANLNLAYQWSSNCKCTKSHTFHYFRSLMCITFAHSIIKNYRTHRKKPI